MGSCTVNLQSKNKDMETNAVIEAGTSEKVELIKKDIQNLKSGYTRLDRKIQRFFWRHRQTDNFKSYNNKFWIKTSHKSSKENSIWYETKKRRKI